MAEGLDDGEFWLPTSFLSEDREICSKQYYGMQPPSDLGSPLDSLIGSTETESDEEDFMAGLTLRMANSTLEDDRGRISGAGFGYVIPKASAPASSPQSTLCDLGRRGGSSQGSSKGPSRGSSPPPSTRDLLYAAAGLVARLNSNEGVGYYDRRNLLNPIQKPNSFPPNGVPASYRDPSSDCYEFQRAQLQFQRMQQMNMMKQTGYGVGGVASKETELYQYPQMFQCSAMNSELSRRVVSEPLWSSPSAWSPLQPRQTPRQRQNDSMRAVFPDSPATKRTSVGTGVFLPRRAGTNCESRKKRECCSAFLPVRVVEALNLNLEDLGVATQRRPCSDGSFWPVSDCELKLRTSHGHPVQPKRNPRPPLPASHEIRLPQEWIY